MVTANTICSHHDLIHTLWRAWQCYLAPILDWVFLFLQISPECGYLCSWLNFSYHTFSFNSFFCYVWTHHSMRTSLFSNDLDGLTSLWNVSMTVFRASVKSAVPPWLHSLLTQSERPLKALTNLCRSFDFNSWLGRDTNKDFLFHTNHIFWNWMFTTVSCNLKGYTKTLAFEIFQTIHNETIKNMFLTNIKLSYLFSDVSVNTINPNYNVLCKIKAW